MNRRKPSVSFAYGLVAAVALSCGSEGSVAFFSQNQSPELPNDIPRVGTGGTTESAGSGAIAGAHNSGASGEAQAGSQSGISGASGTIGGDANGGSSGSSENSGGEASANSGSSGAGGSDGCTSNVECGTGRYCKKPSCLALAGSCADVPAVCDAAEDPVCGCDGYSYVNRCLAELNGQNVAGERACRETAVRCGTQAACRDRTRSVCAFLFAGNDECPKNDSALGSCWVLPERCASDSTIGLESCGLGVACRTLCEAAATRVPHHLSRCDTNSIVLDQ